MKALLLCIAVLLLHPAAARCGWTWAPVGECSTEYWQLEEQWRLGADSDPLHFGTVAVEYDGGGRIYLLNAVLHQIQIYDLEGNFIRSVLRKGEGPGEITTPLDFCFTADGNICVLQGFPAKLVFIDKEGTHLNSLRPRENNREAEPFSIFQALLHGGANYLICENQTKYGSPGTTEILERVWLLDDSFMLEKSIIEKHTKYELEHYDLHERNVFIHLWNRLAVDLQGRVYHAPKWDEYRIVWHDPTGQDHAFLEVTYPHLQRTNETKQKIHEDLKNSPLVNGHPPHAVHAEENWPDIISLHPQEDGTLWVLSSRGFHVRSEGEIYSYDVFDSAGVFRKKVSLRGPGWDEYPAVYFLDKDMILLYTQAYDYEGSEGEEGEIIFCRVARRSKNAE